MRKLYTHGLILLILVVSCSVSSLMAQELENANVQFELEAYDLAIETYESYLESHPNDEQAMYKLALAYERTYDLIRSARWYEKMFLLDMDQPDHVKIDFGRVLRSLGLISQARELFQSCSEPEWQLTASYLQDGCDMAEYLLKMEEMYQLYLFYPSSAMADFAPSIWNDQLVFASFRDVKETDEMKNLQLYHNPGNKLYISALSRKAKSSDVQLLGSGLFQKEGISSCNFSRDGKKVLYTRNNFKNNTRQITGKEKGWSVYLADVDENGDFINEYALPFNSADYAVAFACFGESLNEIFFSSNKHGDHTDFDLYKSSFDGIQWGEPVALGETINTPGNEVTPYFTDGYLYFSSDLIPGMGGFDVFRTKISQGIPHQVMNMGNGINSIADDLYLVKSDESEFYFSSNRIGGKGDYDIYVAIENAFIQRETDFLAASDDPKNEIPKAVSLAKLTDQFSQDVAISDGKAVAYNENVLAPENLSLEGARMVAYGEVIKSSSNVYFIQLASLSSTRGNVKRFKNLVEYGNVYRVKKANSYKIRLGYFYGREEAQTILTQVKNAGFEDAFIVEDVLNIKELELVISSYTFTENEKYQKPETESAFKVRLAAYSNPLYFDTEKVKDLGVIEQWSKGNWTIFIMSGYETLEDAQKARIKAVNRGFTGAEIVQDDNGVLTRVKEN